MPQKPMERIPSGILTRTRTPVGKDPKMKGEYSPKTLAQQQTSIKMRESQSEFQKEDVIDFEPYFKGISDVVDRR